MARSTGGIESGKGETAHSRYGARMMETGSELKIQNPKRTSQSMRHLSISKGYDSRKSQPITAGVNLTQGGPDESTPSVRIVGSAAVKKLFLTRYVKMHRVFLCLTKISNRTVHSNSPSSTYSQQEFNMLVKALFSALVTVKLYTLFTLIHILA